MSSRRRYVLTLPGGRALTLGDRTLVMGVLNVTPDSFADGAPALNVAQTIDAALEMIDAGVDLIDLGGESTRPGAQPVDAAEERRRVMPALEALLPRVTVPISIDTYKGTVAAAALEAGAAIVNDISGLRYDPSLADVVARHQAPIVLMHTRGRPRDMYQHACYDDVVADVLNELRESIAFATRAGIDRERIVIDPGLGFAKQASHSYEALARVEAFVELGRPLLVGPSRKSFLAGTSGRDLPARERDWATAAAVTAAVLGGAHIVRVHAVREMVQVARVADEIRKYHRAAAE